MGGAERQALSLANHLDRNKFDVVIIALKVEGELVPPLGTITIVEVGMKFWVLTILRLLVVIKKRKISVLQSFLLETNIYALLARAFSPKLKVIIGIRDSIDDRLLYCGSRFSRIKMRLLTAAMNRLRPLASLYISNSVAARNLASVNTRCKITVITNGIDINRFKPNSGSRGRLRHILGIPETVRVVGIIANCSVYKDYPTFIRAAKIVSAKSPQVRFVSIGENRTAVGESARNLVRELGIEDKVNFLGFRMDIQDILPGLDVCCSSSITEGFSNSICEALSCGVPCVVTDVGDSSSIVGEAGIVVPPRSPEHLADAILKILAMDGSNRDSLRLAARLRIENNFEITHMVAKHEAIYEALLA